MTQLGNPNPNLNPYLTLSLFLILIPNPIANLKQFSQSHKVMRHESWNRLHRKREVFSRE